MVAWISALISISAVYLLSFIIGYSLLRNHTPFPFFTMLPVFISLGLAVLAFIAYLVGFFIIHGLVIVIVPIPFLFLLLVPLLRKKKLDKPTITLKEIKANLPGLLLFLSSFLFFSITATIMLWPPPGDIISHGLLVSILRHVGRQTFTLEPLSAYSAYYPMGMHVFVADLAELVGLFSGEAFLITGVLIASLIPLLLFSLTYILTHYSFTALLPFLAAFYIHVSGHLEMWVMGYLYNGPYPCFFGYLLSILTVSLVILSRKGVPLAFPSMILVLLQLFVTYPSFTIILGLLTMIILRKELFRLLKNVNRFLLVGVIAASVILLVVFAIPRLDFLIGNAFHSYQLQLSFFQDLSLFIIILGFMIAAITLVIKVTALREVSIFLLGTFLPAFLGTSEVFLPLVGILLPSRLILIPCMLSWVLIAYSMQSLVRNKLSFALTNNKVQNVILKLCAPLKSIRLPYSLHSTKKVLKRSSKYTPPPSKLVSFTLFLLVSLILTPSLLYHVGFVPARNWGWYMSSSGFQANYAVSSWISVNVPPDDLILNDMSFSGFYLPSYTYKNIVFHYLPHPVEYNRAREIWLHPDNETLVRSVLQELNIKWVFTTSDELFFDTWLYGGNSQYKKKPFSPTEYNYYFCSYSFLQVAYKWQETAVYEVLLSSE